jgi:hypothetical protein
MALNDQVINLEPLYVPHFSLSPFEKKQLPYNGCLIVESQVVGGYAINSISGITLQIQNI